MERLSRTRARGHERDPAVDRIADDARVVGDLRADAVAQVLLDRVLVEIGVRVAAVDDQEDGARVDGQRLRAP